MLIIKNNQISSQSVKNKIIYKQYLIRSVLKILLHQELIINSQIKIKCLFNLSSVILKQLYKVSDNKFSFY